MASFDFDNYKAVGIVENIPASNHSYIHVIGYCEMYSSNIHRYSNEEARNIFSKKGRVFAYMFGQKNPDLNGHCVSLAIMPNEKPGEGLDEYVWDWSVDVIDIASPVLKIVPDSLGTDGQKNYSILSNHELLNVSHDTYIESNGCVYLIKANSIERMIKYWTFSDLEVKCSDDSVLLYNGKLYIAGGLCDNSGVVDITTDDQLIDWFCKKILKPRWDEYVSNKNYKEIESNIKDVLGSVNLDSSIYNSRLKRLKTLNTNLQLSFENLQDISLNPWFKNLLQSAVARFKENYVSEVEKANEAEIKRLQEEHNQLIEVENERYKNATKDSKEEFENTKIQLEIQLESIKEEVTNRGNELANINAQIETKKETLKQEEAKWSSIQEKKDAIIEDFGVIRDVLNIQSTSGLSQASSSQLSTMNIDLENTASEYVQVFMKRLELILQAYGVEESDAQNTTQLLAKHKISITNDIRTIHSILKASGNCVYMVEYVTPKWNSFEDLWQNGLSMLVEEAKNNTLVQHFLILRNMNLSYIPSYVQPIIDIENGLCDTLYNTGEKLPFNLRILGHVTDDSLMPINIYSLEDIGCIKKYQFKKRNIEISKLDLPSGYLTPFSFNDLSSEQGEVVSYVEEYLSEDE